MRTDKQKKMESFKKIFFLMGLNIVLFMTYRMLEMQTETGRMAKLDFGEVEEDPVILTDYTIEYPAPKKKSVPVKRKKVEVDNIRKKDPVDIKIIDNNARQKQETPVNSTSIEATTPSSQTNTTPVVVEKPKSTGTTYSITGIESAPVFPGCQGGKEQLRKCFSEKIQAYVREHFDPETAIDAGLNGVVRIRVQFVVDTDGSITSIKVRAPHKSLENEMRQLISALPAMIPGKQNGTPVKVRYYLPVVFKVEY